ncbi:hypothetical protein RUND412_004891 [Rhizina undulata]
MAFNFPDPESLTLHGRISLLSSCIPAVIARIQSFEAEVQLLLAYYPHTTWSQAIALITDIALIQDDIRDVLGYAVRAHDDCLFQFSMINQVLATNPHISPSTRAVMVEEAEGNLYLLEIDDIAEVVARARVQI